MAGAFSIEPDTSIGALPRVRIKGTMTDSVFWRDLHDKFVAFQDRLRASSGATCLTYKQFEVLAKRGASEIAHPGTPNLLSVWLEAVWKEDPDFRSSFLAKEVSSLAEFEQNSEIGTLDSMCQSSATFCKKLEDQALQAEFEEKQRNIVGTITTAKSEPRSAKAKVHEVPMTVDHPPFGTVDRVDVVIPTPQLTNGSRDHGPEAAIRQGKVDVSAKVLENSKDTILSRAAGAVSETLLREVTRLFKAVFKFHYESAEEVGQSPEWQEMNRLFSDAVDTYVNIAMNNRRKMHDDLFLWVKEQIEANESAILIQHFGSGRNGYSAPKERSQIREAHNHDAWRAQEHMGFMNQNSVFWVCQKKVVHAGSVALGYAAIRIASGHPA
jgi:23S rRNA U2552 (ribose-2'-O)-methylase RlmE/FtsJ